MTTFILIMTLWSNDMAGHAYVHSVRFRGEENCQRAAKQWLGAFYQTTEKRTAVCVPYN